MSTYFRPSPYAGPSSSPYPHLYKKFHFCDQLAWSEPWTFISWSVPSVYPSALVHVLVMKILFLTPPLLALEVPEIPVSGNSDYAAVWYWSLIVTNGIVYPWWRDYLELDREPSGSTKVQTNEKRARKGEVETVPVSRFKKSLRQPLRVLQSGTHSALLISQS